TLGEEDESSAKTVQLRPARLENVLVNRLSPAFVNVKPALDVHAALGPVAELMLPAVVRVSMSERWSPRSRTYDVVPFQTARNRLLPVVAASWLSAACACPALSASAIAPARTLSFFIRKISKKNLENPFARASSPGKGGVASATID